MAVFTVVDSKQEIGQNQAADINKAMKKYNNIV